VLRPGGHRHCRPLCGPPVQVRSTLHSIAWNVTDAHLRIMQDYTVTCFSNYRRGFDW
jgi:hypothetical protein